MNWGEFNAKVLTLLTVNAERGGCENVLPVWILGAVLDIQDHVPSMRAGHETIYESEDFATDGACSVGVFPSGMVNRREVNLIKKESEGVAEDKWPVILEDWESRNEFIYGHRGSDIRGSYFVDPLGYKFVVWPMVAEGYVLSVTWDGKRDEFEDEDSVPFTDKMAEVVADYVTAKLKRTVDNDIQAYASFMQSYGDGRRKLFVSSVAQVNQG